MSRIYEALQKAESDRKLERPERPQERNERPQEQTEYPPIPAASNYAAAAVAEYELPDALPASSAFPTSHFAAAQSAAIPSFAAPASAIQGSPLLDLDSVPRRAWTPSYAQLPALMERGASVEQFRSLRSRIHELRDISPLKSILVSSGLPQEGKSFVATNLAISLARHKNGKVLLIDGDMRRYTLHQLLGCESHPGLADYLAGKAGMLEVMQRAEEATGADKVKQAVLPNLTFIAGGNGGDKAADLSGNPRFGELLQAAAPYFDWIVVDSSPVLPVSDAVNLARSCDGVLLVARGGVTQFQTAQRAQSELKASNILGFVLNAVEHQPHVGTYYGYDAEKE